MPDGVTVQGPDNKTYQFPVGTTKEAAIAYFKKKGIGVPAAKPGTPSVDTTPESALTKAARGTVLGAAEGVGIPNTTDPLGDLWKNITERKDSVMEALKDSIMPGAGIIKGIHGAQKEAAEAIGDKSIMPFDVRNAMGDLKRLREGTAPNVDIEQFAHGISSLFTQLLSLKGGKEALETPISEGQVLKGAKGASRAALGVTAEDVGKARSSVEQANKAAVEESRAAQSQAKASARGKYEADEAAQQKADAERIAKNVQKMAKYDADLAEAKARHQAEIDAYEQSVSGSVSRESHARLKDARLEKAEKQLSTVRDQTAKDLSANLDKAEKAEYQNLQTRYKELDNTLLKGLNSDATTITDAVADAKNNILKGSPTNIPIFNAIMSGREFVEGVDGSLSPVSGQMMPTSQLRGFITELNSAMYDRNLPGDVREAIKHVAEVGKDEVAKSIRDVHGATGEAVYNKLSEDYSNYKRIWYDDSPNHPLARIRRILRDPSVEKSGLSVDQQISKVIKGEKGSNVVKILAEKARYGADPKLAAKLMALDEKLAKIGDLYEKIPVAKYPRFPQEKEVQPPKLERREPESTVTEFKAPAPPELKTFDPEDFVRSAVESRAKSIARWGIAGSVAWAVRDILEGRVPSFPLMATPIVQHYLTKMLTSERFIKWLTKGM